VAARPVSENASLAATRDAYHANTCVVVGDLVRVVFRVERNAFMDALEANPLVALAFTRKDDR
jgi:hypothetical protein